MSFRTVVISNRCKLEYCLNFLVIRNQEGEKRIAINEISTMIIQSTSISLTTALLSSLVSNNVKIILCDEKGNPQSEVMPYYSTYNCYEKLKWQSSINSEIKDKIWKEIIIEKIKNQSRNVKSLEIRDKLNSYTKEVDNGDTSNREGHAAKIYFSTLFGNNFSRNDDCPINAYLNYGYSIILSCINRTIKSLGYYTELGIHHIGKTNPFNLSCDLMEPLRPLVDSIVLKGELNKENFKGVMVNLLNLKVDIYGNSMFLENAIKVYVQSIFIAIEHNDVGYIKFINYEL